MGSFKKIRQFGPAVRPAIANKFIFINKDYIDYKQIYFRKKVYQDLSPDFLWQHLQLSSSLDQIQLEASQQTPSFNTFMPSCLLFLDL